MQQALRALRRVTLELTALVVCYPACLSTHPPQQVASAECFEHQAAPRHPRAALANFEVESQVAGRLAGQLVGQLADLLAGRLAGELEGVPVRQAVDRVARQLGGKSARQLAGQLAGPVAGRLG